jgi:phosphonatase-like hydrolase
MGLELIIFDLAGTTVEDNKDVHRVLQSTLKTFGVSITTEDANAVMGIPKPIAIEQLLREKKHPDISSSFIRQIHELFVAQMIDFYRQDPGVREKNGVSEVFMALKADGIKVAVDTGFDRAITNPLLERMGWRMKGLLDLSVTSDEVPNGRPFPDLIIKAMEMAGVRNAKHVAKVGDTASDLQEGTAAGCGMVIGITSGAFTRIQLQKEPHTHLIDEMYEILPLVGIF